MNWQRSMWIILLFVIINCDSIDANEKIKEETAQGIGAA